MRSLAMALLFLAAPWCARAQHAVSSERDSSRARIVVTRTESRLGIAGLYRNGADLPASLHYELTTIKRGASSSRNTQAGRFECAPHAEATLSTVTVNTATGDEVSVVLRILDGTTLVASDSLSIRGNPRCTPQPDHQ